jgi:hypothetical protein
VDANDGAGDGAVLDHLAEVRSRGRSDLATLVEQVRSRSDGGLVIGLFGLLAPAEAEVLARLRTSGVTCVAFVIDRTTWLNLPAETRSLADREHNASVVSLLEAGWRVIGVSRGAKLEALWPRAARGSQGFALRAALAETVSGGLR